MPNLLQTCSIFFENTDELTQQKQTYINMRGSMKNNTVYLKMGRVVSYNHRSESPSVPSVVCNNQLLNVLESLHDCDVF